MNTQNKASDCVFNDNVFDVLSRVAKAGNIHAQARIIVLNKFFAILAPAFESANAIAETVPGEFKFGTERHRAWVNEMFRQQNCNWQLFQEFMSRETINPDDIPPDVFLCSPFEDSYSARIQTENPG